LSPKNIPYPPTKAFDPKKYANFMHASDYNLTDLKSYWMKKYSPIDPYKRPQSWFELYYSRHCDGKASCSIPIHMLPKTADKRKAGVWNYSEKCKKLINDKLKKSVTNKKEEPRLLLAT
jgi:hypothetical protein